MSKKTPTEPTLKFERFQLTEATLCNKFRVEKHGYVSAAETMLERHGPQI